MTEIPIYRSAHLMPFINYCNRHGLAYKNVFQQFKIPTLLEPEYDIYLPWHSTCEALEKISVVQGVNDFSVRAVVDMKLKDFGLELDVMLRQTVSLYQAIAKFKHLVRLEDTTAYIDLWYEGDQCWLRNKVVEASFTSNTWANLMAMVSLVREFVGQQWTPSHICLPDKNAQSSFVKSKFTNTTFINSPNAIGFKFPKIYLSRKPIQRALYDNIIVDNETLSIGDGIKGMIRGYLLSGYKTNISFISELIGINPRTLQRQLKSAGVSYSELMDDVRLDKATFLLKSTKMNLLEVAMQIGFSDDAHFVRFFKRMTSLTPREYRLGEWKMENGKWKTDV